MLTDSDLNGRYRVLGHIGSGGSGEVWLVEHTLLGRREALKVLQSGVAETPEQIARFRREARALNRLQHPNIIGVHDFGKLPDGRLYLSMEYVEGHSLATVLRRGPMPLRRGVLLLIQLADAIEHAHERGVRHRDLKPGNLVLVERRAGLDTLKVLDFGLAKIVAPGHRDSIVSTHGDGIFGTPAYMAPEQIDGLTDDHRVDLYSFGCIAYEIVTGRPPFVGKPFAVLDAHQRIAPAPPSQHSPSEVPAELDALILECLAKQASARIQSGAQLAQRLRQLAARSEPGDRRSTPPTDALDVTELGGRSHAPRGTSTLSPMAEYQRSLRELGNALLDAGATEVDLITGLAQIAHLRSQLTSAEDELDELARSGERAESRSRLREAEIRFSLGELRFSRDSALGLHAVRATQLDLGIGELEQELRDLVRTRTEAVATVADREVELVAAIANQTEKLDALCAGVELVLWRALAGVEQTPTLRLLAGRLQARRVTVGSE